MEEITGTLRNWYVEMVNETEGIVWGHVFGDSRRRFRDGTFIHTSGVIVANHALIEGEVIQTRNSRYLLGTPVASR